MYCQDAKNLDGSATHAFPLWAAAVDCAAKRETGENGAIRRSKFRKLRTSDLEPSRLARLASRPHAFATIRHE